MNRRSLAVSIALVALLGLTQLPAQGAVQVRAQRSGTSFVFSPRAPHVAVGSMVTWRAVTGSHTVTSTSSNWSKNTNLPAGSTTSFTFRRAGTYRYRCRLHSTLVGGQCTGMCGKIDRALSGDPLLDGTRRGPVREDVSSTRSRSPRSVPRCSRTSRG